MRQDMAKVIVERPRTRGGYARKGRAISDEFLPKNEGMKQPYGYNKKELNENLTPLRRFLLSCAGRPWNDVYSEISEHLRPTSTVQQHVRDHIKDYVVINPHKAADGKLYEIRYWRGMQPIEKTQVLLYVDPDTGILTKNPGANNTRGAKNTPGTWAYKKEQERKEATTNLVQLTDGNELRCLDGIWYRFTWDIVPPAGQQALLDIDGKEYIKRIPQRRTDLYTGMSAASDKMYRNTKHQLNNRDLKFYGLANS